MTLNQFEELIMETSPLTLNCLPTFIKLDPKWSPWKQKHCYLSWYVLTQLT